MATTRRRPTRTKEDKLDSISPARVPPFVRGAILKGHKRIKLYHLTEDGQNIVQAWDLGRGGDGESEEDAEALAHQIVTAAQDEAQNLGGHQRYAIVVVDADGRPAGRKLFDVRSDGEAEEDAGPSENATPKGLMGQLMRHNENTQRVFSSMFGDVLYHFQTSLQKADQRISQLEGRELEVIDMRERLMTSVHSRAMQEAQEARKSELQGKLLGEITNYIPIVASRLLTGGKPGAKPPPALGEEQIRNLLGSLLTDERKLASLATILSAQELAMVGELARMYAKDEQDKKAAKEAAENKKSEAS